MKIYDCFPFNNEISLLDFRLKTFWDYVDFFVISESEFAFDGSKKKKYATDFVQKYYPNSEKIKIVSYEPPHEMVENLTKDRWPLENLARQSLSLGFNEADENDFIILSDVDEFPSLEQLENALGQEVITAAITPMFFRKANFLVIHSQRWQKVRMGPRKLMLNLNEIRQNNYPPVTGNVGMHLSYLEKTTSDVIAKHKTSAHSEIDMHREFLEEALSVSAKYFIDHLGRFNTLGFGLMKILKEEELNAFQKRFLDYDPSYYIFEAKIPNYLARVSASRQLTEAWNSKNLDALKGIENRRMLFIMLDCLAALRTFLVKFFRRVTRLLLGKFTKKSV